MPEFHLDTEGAVLIPRTDPDAPSPFNHVRFDDLEDFTQGYIEALFSSAVDSGMADKARRLGRSCAATCLFSDLAPETLVRIIADCEKFQQEYRQAADAHGADCKDEDDAAKWPGDARAGRDFWLTRNGHGWGFEVDWPEPYAEQLFAAATACGGVSAYMGDDGKVYLS